MNFSKTDAPRLPTEDAPLPNRSNRLKSIHTPPRRDRVAPSKRGPREDEGPTPFQLLRKAEVIGKGIVYDPSRQRFDVEGGPAMRAEAEFASSSSLAWLWVRKRIEAHQYRAGCMYGRLRIVTFGRTTPRQSAISKALASSLEDRIHAATQARRDEMDDEEYEDWLADQRTLLERGEYRISHMETPQRWRHRGHAFAHAASFRKQVRAILRAVCIDDQQPRDTQIDLLRMGLQELSDVWDLERT